MTKKGSICSGGYKDLSEATKQYHERLAKELIASGKDELDITENPIYDTKNIVFALEAAYRKHVLDDETIGWEELADMLCDQICNVVGGDVFSDWLEQWDTGEKSLSKFMTSKGQVVK